MALVKYWPMLRPNKRAAWCRVLGFAACLLVSIQGGADIAADGHSRLSTYLSGLDQVMLEFEQFDASQQLIQRGRLYLVQPGQFRMETDPASVLVVSDGTDVFEVDYLLEQITVYSLSGEVRRSPLGLFLAPAESLLEYEVVEGIGDSIDAQVGNASGDDAATSKEFASIKTFALFPNQDNQYVTRADLRFEDGWPAKLDIAVAGGGSMHFLFVEHSELTKIDPDWFLAPPLDALEMIDHRTPAALNE
ncbi:MAG TPA: hypothetical protein DCG80_03700 [Idiomarina sp.]|nr:hypothetical protein [Idiomarina sp.]